MAYINNRKIITAVQTQSVNQSVTIAERLTGTLNVEDTLKVKDAFTIIIFTFNIETYYFRKVYDDGSSCNYSYRDGTDKKTISINYLSNGTSTYTINND